MSDPNTNTETQGSLPRQPFLALGTAALWFFVYVLAHDTFTARHQEISSPSTKVLYLSPKLAESLPPKVLKNLQASYERGANSLDKCIICHDVKYTEKAKPRYGPLIANPFGTVPGSQTYAYSPALEAMAVFEEHWSVQQLWAFIYDPKKFAESTRMPFEGLRDARKSTDLVHYFAWNCGVDCETPVLLKLDLETIKTRKSTDLLSGDCIVLDNSVDQLSFNPFASAEFFLVPEIYANCQDSVGETMRGSIEVVPPKNYKVQ